MKTGLFFIPIFFAAVCAYGQTAQKGGQAGPAKVAQTDKINECDMSVTDSSSTKKNWKSADGREWTAISMEEGFALCLFSNRYLIFDSKPEDVLSIGLNKGNLEISFGSSKENIALTYLTAANDIFSKIAPYRGYPAEDIYWARAQYDLPGSTKASGAVYRIGSEVSERTDIILARFAKDSMLWKNADSAVKRLKSWINEEKAKENWTSLRDMEPQVALTLNLPEYKAPAAQAVRPQMQAPRFDPKAKAAKFSCGDKMHAGNNSPHKILTVNELFPVQK